MLEAIVIVAGVLATAVVLSVMTVKNLIYICAPNEVLIFSGKRTRVGNRVFGYRLVKGGRGVRVPLFEKVSRLDLTNMIIDVTARSAYSKGGIPLIVQGVANVKVAGHDPLINNAIERFLGKQRREIMQVAKATLEGSLRGVLATMTPEQVNDDRLLFAERLVQQVEDDMASLGLVVDTLKIQNVHDEVNYLNSIGRKKNAEVVRKARIAEASAHADAVVRTAENRESEAKAKFGAQLDMVKADAEKRLADALTRRDAVVAEEQATVAAQVAQARAELGVQRARIAQTRLQLEADVIQPAKARCLATEAAAKAAVSPILEDGKARAEVLRTLGETWAKSGDNARQVFLMQKLDRVIDIVTGLIAETRVEKVTMIDGRAPSLFKSGALPLEALGSVEQLKQLFGVDLVEKLGAVLEKPTHAGSAALSGPKKPG